MERARRLLSKLTNYRISVNRKRRAKHVFAFVVVKNLKPVRIRRAAISTTSALAVSLTLRTDQQGLALLNETDASKFRDAIGSGSITALTPQTHVHYRRRRPLNPAREGAATVSSSFPRC
jgi:hypothetical protein